VWLKLLGARVSGYALAAEPNGSSLFDLARVGDGMVSVIADIRDRDALSACIAKEEPEIVFHLAAQPLVRRSYDDPVATYDVNILGTAHLLEVLRYAPSVRSIVVVTSDKCYENHEWERGYRETDELGGHDPYSSSKACVELLTAAFRRSFFTTRTQPVGIATARAGNVIGGGDWSADRIVPDIMRALAAQRSVVLRNPASYRPWQHVLEPLSGYLALAERLWYAPAGFSESWNFGPRADETISVMDLTKRFVLGWGTGQIEVDASYDGKHEARALGLDCEKASRKLNWAPRLTSDEMIEMTVEWYRLVYADRSAAPEITAQQIRTYHDVVAWPQARPMAYHAPRTAGAPLAAARVTDAG
jgi:CDP-glucose 4,6-dehydratase